MAWKRIKRRFTTTVQNFNPVPFRLDRAEILNESFGISALGNPYRVIAKPMRLAARVGHIETQ
jgi:hypothetical protein